MITTLSAVRAICIYRDWEVSNLSIQKLLYISQMIHLGRYSENQEKLNPLIKSSFHAWAYGPVIPSVYKKLKMFGAENVQDFYTLAIESAPDESQVEYETIKYVCEKLKEFKSHQLVAYTHNEDGAWRLLYKNDPNITIPNIDIYHEYQRRFHKKSG